MSWGLREFRVAIALIPLGIGVVACSGSEGRVTPFKPPTIEARATPPGLAVSQPTPTSPEVHPTTTPACIDSLTFLEDITIPDGTIVNTGDLLDKRWLIKNSGGCNWDEEYRMKLVSGPDLSVPVEQALYPARSGFEATLRIVFTAPQEPGYYQSAWQAFNPEDVPFGDPFFIEVQVETPTSQP